MPPLPTVLLLEGMPWNVLIWFLFGGVALGIWRAGKSRAD